METKDNPVMTTDWAREHGEQFTYRALLDNYDPPRTDTIGLGWRYDMTPLGRGKGIVLNDGSDFRDADDGVWLLDDGKSVDVYYTAGWHPRHRYLIIHPFPLSVGTRPDNGRDIDMSGWLLGPRRAFHLKVIWA